MEKRCKNILQNYLKTHVYNTDYKIIDNFLIKYKNITLFYVVSKTKYIKHNICNIIQKEYNSLINFEPEAVDPALLENDEPDSSREQLNNVKSFFKNIFHQILNNSQYLFVHIYEYLYNY